MATGVDESTDFFGSFGASFMVILATEVGDKTFFIAAVMAMRHSRLLTWSGAVAALVLMTVLSTAVGHLAPLLLPKVYTHYAAAMLFLYFGGRMLKDGFAASHGASDELEEVELELSKKQDVESASAEDSPRHTDADDAAPRAELVAAGGFAAAETREVLLQAFTLTFLAEWGDRSQIATIALATHREPIGVTLGGCIGHAMCTGLAVVGGKMLASRISERTVLIAGGALFVVFALVGLLLGP